MAVITATNGLPSEKGDSNSKFACDNFVPALKSLEEPPIWTVIKLCTNERNVVEFYQELDDQLELPIYFLGDFVK